MSVVKALQQNLDKIQAELASQEAVYAAKVAQVQAEHDQKVMDALRRRARRRATTRRICRR